MDSVGDNSEMVDLAKPNRLRHVVIMLICSPFIGVLVWISTEFANDPNRLSLVGFLLILSFATFPITRSLHALFAKPYFRANQEHIEIRHWGGYWLWFLPCLLVKCDRLRWKDILAVDQKLNKHNGLTIENYAIVERNGKKPIHIHRGVFSLSVDAIIQLILNRISSDEYRAVFPSERAKPYVKRLEARFASTLALQYSPRPLLLSGLITGPSIGIAGLRWLYINLGENQGLDIAVALASCGAVAWLAFAIVEAVRSVRFRNKKFWFRRDGLVVGSHELTARVYPWHEILGARRRVTIMRDQWDKPEKPKFEGLDILLRDGGTVWIPEQYSAFMDELAEDLSPNEDEAFEVLTPIDE